MYRNDSFAQPKIQQLKPNLKHMKNFMQRAFFLLLTALMVNVSNANSLVKDPVGKQNATLKAEIKPDLASADALFKVSFEQEGTKKVSLIIRDDYGNNLYRQTFSGMPRYNGVFNLSQLEDGVYTFVITNGTESYTQSFTIKTQFKVNRTIAKL